MLEDIQAIKAKWMKHEKLIKDVMRTDGRSTSQIISTLRKEVDKEKNILPAKFVFLYKTAQAFAPTSGQTLSETHVRMVEHLMAILQNQIKFLSAMMESVETRTAQKARDAVFTSADIKGIIQQYIETKELLKRKIKEFILTKRAGLLSGRVDQAMAPFKSSGQLDAMDPDNREVLRNKQEAAILVELVIDEMANRTAKIDQAVGKIVDWRARAAQAGAVEQEINRLIRELLVEINSLKERERLVGASESGITQSAEGLAGLAKLRSIVLEQKNNLSVLADAVIPKKDAGTLNDLKALENPVSKEESLGVCDRIETLIKDERNLYLDLRKFESIPGRFLEDLTLATEFLSPNN